MKNKDILSYTFEEYITMMEHFHGSVAPGILIGGFMVNLACRNLPKNTMYNVICETTKCLPDAVQLLTQCTIGNQRLKIMNVGRYALTFYERDTGWGIRVYLDYKKTEPWSEVKNWYLKLKPKHMQNKQLLLSQIKEAGINLLGIEKIDVNLKLLGQKHNSRIAICPFCDEAYRVTNGTAVCPACREEILPYVSKTIRAAKAAL